MSSFILTAEYLQENVAGIGAVKANRLVEFCSGDVQKMLDTPIETVVEEAEISRSAVQSVQSFLRKQFRQSSAGEEEIDDFVDEFEEEAKSPKKVIKEENQFPALAIHPNQSVGVSIKDAYDEYVGRYQADEEDELTIVKSVIIDDFTVARTRIPFKPSMCPVCAFDVCAHNKLPPWDSMEKAWQEQVKTAIKKHLEFYHPAHEGGLIPKSKVIKSNLRTGKSRR